MNLSHPTSKPEGNVVTQDPVRISLDGRPMRIETPGTVEVQPGTETDIAQVKSAYPVLIGERTEISQTTGLEIVWVTIGSITPGRTGMTTTVLVPEGTLVCISARPYSNVTIASIIADFVTVDKPPTPRDRSIPRPRSW
jgi:hypothetical protein